MGAHAPKGKKTVFINTHSRIVFFFLG